MNVVHNTLKWLSFNKYNVCSEDVKAKGDLEEIAIFVLSWQQYVFVIVVLKLKTYM